MGSESWKYVSVGKCIKIIIFCAIAACVAVIPITFGTDAGTVFTYKLMPYVGDGSFFTAYVNEAFFNKVILVIPQIAAYAEYVPMLYTYGTYAYFGILAADIVFSVLLILFRANIFRMLFRFISFFMALAMLVIAAAYGVFIYISVLDILSGVAGVGLIDAFKTLGVTTALGFAIMGLILFFKQLKWFRKPYPNSFYRS